MLAGLHSSIENKAPLLSGIDYISSVSGGSWANGSYWSTGQPDEKLFSCLNDFAEKGVPNTDCKPPLDKLRNTQEISYLPYDDEEVIKKRKSIWEEDIIDTHLLKDCNIDFDSVPRKGYDHSKAAPCRKASGQRPYPIFNSTHSSSDEEASASHHSFQSTPDYQGTVTDDKEYRGFFLKSGSAKFLWKNRDWKRWLPGGVKDHPGEVLSLMMAHSSGVLGSNKPFLLQYNFHVHFQDDETKSSAIKGLRRIYKLADGGKSDNLGLLPLLERGVDTIIVSQMGKEGDDFEDITLAATQANNLFGCTFKSDWKRDVSPVVTTAYRCPDASGGQREGTLILVRPTVQNVKKFLEELNRQNPSLGSKLKKLDEQSKPKDRFPETPTFKTIYEPELIRAYFLLGRYLAETTVRDAFLRSHGVQ